MNRRIAGLVGCLLLLTLVTGCATKHEGGFNPAFFPRAGLALEASQGGRVALWVRSPAKDFVYTVTRDEALGLQVPIGRIVEEAVLASVGQMTQGGALRVNEAPIADGGFAATLVIDAVRMELDHEKYTVVLPLPPFITWVGATAGHVAFDLRLLDVQGRAVWSRTYDSGREDWQRFSITSGEEVPVAIGRMAHETAWRLSQQVAADLRRWLAEERSKPRELSVSGELATSPACKFKLSRDTGLAHLILELGAGQVVRALVDTAQISQLLNAVLDLGFMPIDTACRDGPNEHSIRRRDGCLSCSNAVSHVGQDLGYLSVQQDLNCARIPALRSRRAGRPRPMRPGRCPEVDSAPVVTPRSELDARARALGVSRQAAPPAGVAAPAPAKP